MLGKTRNHMENVSIRIAEKSDIKNVSELFDLYRQFYEQDPNINLAENFIGQRINNNESIILIAEDGHNSIVGFCQLYPTFCSVIASPIYALYDLFVIANKRRGNVGKLLLLAAEETAKSNGVSRMDLTTAKSNLAAQSLYESLDWEKDNVFIAYNKNIKA